MVSIGKEEIVQHFTAADIDSVAEILLSKASTRFLDMALDTRLRTIEAKPLINALARAERLGYEPGDILEEDQQHGLERVIPQPEAYPGAGAQQIPAMLSGPAHTQPQCPVCFRVFQHRSAFEHVSRIDLSS